MCIPPFEKNPKIYFQKMIDLRDKIKKDLKFKPKINLSKGLKLFNNWLSE